MRQVDAIKIIQNAYPKKYIAEGFVIRRNNKEYYVFAVLDSPNSRDYNSPYHAVTEEGKIVSYSPMEDFDEFLTARRNTSFEVLKA